MKFWRELTLKEEQEFRQWARENYKLGEPVDELWHPVVRDEISKMAHEKLGLGLMSNREEAAWKAREKAIAQAWEAHQEAKAQAWNIYQEAKAQAERDYKEARKEDEG